VHRIGDVLFLLVIVALALVVTRKGSQSANVISAIGSSFANAIGAATGGGGGGRKGRRG
jgi:hypothetical protein